MEARLDHHRLDVANVGRQPADEDVAAVICVRSRVTNEEHNEQIFSSSSPSL